eukprot:SAG22_NODE_152_length_17377_cov_191.856928_20_plen_138_part_00
MLVAERLVPASMCMALALLIFAAIELAVIRNHVYYVIPTWVYAGTAVRSACPTLHATIQFDPIARTYRMTSYLSVSSALGFGRRCCISSRCRASFSASYTTKKAGSVCTLRGPAPTHSVRPSARVDHRLGARLSFCD